MDVLVVGGGAREHALVRALLDDPGVTSVAAAPGNAGIAADVAVHPVDSSDPAGVAALASALGVDLVVIGPEVPLVAGAADAVRAAGIACFGPSAAAARLEGSKAFAKEVMAAASVPTAQAVVCHEEDGVARALDRFGPPYVVKDDGLAAGKGVVVTENRQVALEHAWSCLRRPDDAGVVVVEEYLDGPEVSLFCLSDGDTVVPLLPAQDFKRVGDGDTGPNTGGMGAYAPLDWAPAGLTEAVVRDVADPVIREMARRGHPFVGLLYIGLAITSRGVKVVEFNARFGDPETQVVLALLDSGLGAALYAAATGTLRAFPPLQWKDAAAVTVVVASAGYPAAPRNGDPIAGLLEADAHEAVWVLHAGTAPGPDGSVVSAGGRVLSVTAVGADLAQARSRAYDAVAVIDLPGGHHRTDIGLAAERGEIVV